MFTYLYSLVYTDFVPASVASRCLTYETISTLECFDLVLHLTGKVLLQVITDKGFELFFWKHHDKLIGRWLLRLKESFGYYLLAP